MKRCVECGVEITDGTYCENCAFNYWVNVTKNGNQDWYIRLRKIIINDFLVTEIKPLLDKDVKERTRVDWEKGAILRELLNKVNNK